MDGTPMSSTITLRLARIGKSVSPIGLGCMGMSPVYGPVDDQESLRVMHRYVDLGGNFLDTAERYGPFDNEILVGRFLREVARDGLIVATKFGFRIDPTTRVASGLDSSPENVRRVCEASLKRLGVEAIDLFYQHRVDPRYPIEETVGAMAELVAAGKVRSIGLSEASASTLRRAARVHPITALQSEYSLWTRDPEWNGTLETCRELGVAFVAYSPLGRGFLSGKITNSENLHANDWRRTTPRFATGALAKNRSLVEVLARYAKAKGCTPAQIAIAWVMHRGPSIPIPGTKRVTYLEENMAATGIRLTHQEIAELAEAFPHGAAAGARYSASGMATLDGETVQPHSS